MYMMVVISVFTLRFCWLRTQKTFSTKLPYLEMWKHLNNISQNLSKPLTIFKMVLSVDDLVLMLDMLDDFSKTMDKYNLTYFMDAGTLLGSYRHHGMIPWDDDIDLFADVEQYKQVRTALDTMKDKYIVSVHSKGLLKLHSRNDSKTYLFSSSNKTFPWKWPFLDVFWFQRNGSSIYRIHKPKEIYKISDIFPPVKRPFGSLMLNSPCDTATFLTKKFHNWKLCAPPNWNHVKESSIELKKMLYDCNVMYPVVQRERFTNDTTLEYLYYNDKLSSSFVEHQTC